MRRFGTQGPVNPKDNYVVARSEELADFISRVKEGRYIVLFAHDKQAKPRFSKMLSRFLGRKGKTIFRYSSISRSTKTSHLTSFMAPFVEKFVRKFRRFSESAANNFLRNSATFW